MPTYAGINGTVRELSEWPCGINGVVRQQTGVWAGVGGVARQIFKYVTLSAFVLNGVTYNFEPGMDWNAFVASAYNPGIFRIHLSSYVLTSDNKMVYPERYQGYPVSPMDYIIDGKTYYAR